MPSQSGEFLFGQEFAKHLQDKVQAEISLAKVIPTSQRYHPYNKSHYWALKTAVFLRKPGCKLVVTAGLTLHPNTSKPLQEMGLNKAKSTLQQLNRYIDTPHFKMEGLHIPTPAGSLYGQDRPKGRIFNSPGGQRFTTISGLPRPRGSPVSVQSASIRTLHCSLHVHKTNKTISPVPLQR